MLINTGRKEEVQCLYGCRPLVPGGVSLGS
jgi:hypothetical protein